MATFYSPNIFEINPVSATVGEYLVQVQLTDTINSPVTFSFYIIVTAAAPNTAPTFDTSPVA